ncbi:MAG: TonB-dependent receptor [Candidatus Oleimicrobiaceae bacterium]
MTRALVLLTAVVLTMGMTGWTQGGTTGKIVGRVVEAETGQPLAAANVTVVGTTLGAATDAQGYFFVHNVPPGVYRLRASMIGYKSVEVANVRVNADLTTAQNFSLALTVIEGEVVTLVAERPLVEKDVTAKMAVVAGDDMADKMPVSSVQEVLRTQAGFVEDQHGELHLRGGRQGEVAYYLDGILIQDPLQGGLGTSIDVNIIQELSVLTGGFNAEYGDAMSGVINITTKSGGASYTGKLQYESPMLNSSPYHKPDWLLDTEMVKGLSERQKAQYRDAVRYYSSASDTVGTSGYRHVSVLDDPVGKQHVLIPALGQLNGVFSGPVPGLANATFFASGLFRNEDSYLPWGFDLDRQIFAKLSYRFSPDLKVSVDAHNTWNYRQQYNHYYKYIPPAYNDPADLVNYNARLRGERALEKRSTDRQTISVSHALSKATFYTLNLQRLFRRGGRFIPGKSVPYDARTGALVDTAATQYVKLAYLFGTEGDFWGGDDRDWYREHTTTYNLKWDVTSQVHRNHQVKAGVDFKQHQMFRHYIRDPWPGAFRHRLEYYRRDPWEAAVYVQDKMEYDFLIVNVGLRLDYARANDTYWPDPGDIQETVSRVDEEGKIVKEFRFKQRAPVPDRYQVSPRIGIAHPVTDRLVFHFAYGHFFQNPDYYHLFRNDRSLLNLEESDVIIGNPGLRPQRTVAFEVGGKYQIAPDLALDFTGFYKDIRDLTTTKFFARQPYNYTIYINEDYGSVKGFDLTLVKRHRNYLSGTVNYTYSVAKGSGSDPLAGYYYREEEAHLRPKREFYLDFDRTHDFSANVDLRFPSGWGPQVLGMRPCAGLGINLLVQMASGLPYTPSAQGVVSLETNSERKPWVSSVDVRVDKAVSLGSLEVVCYAKVSNLFDHLNVRDVWSETGEPWNAGPYNYRTKDRQANPANVGPRRDLRLGLYLRL